MQQTESSKRALVFFPHNPYPPHTGAHQRCLYFIKALKELGYEVTLFSSTIFTDNPWTEESRVALKERLGIDVEVHEATASDSQYIEYVQNIGTAASNFSAYTPLNLKKSFRQVFEQRSPHVVVVNYALWTGLVLGKAFDSAVRVLDTLDLASLNLRMRSAMAPYITPLPTCLTDINPAVLEETFFETLELDATDEEYWLCDQFDHTIGISPYECQKIQDNASHAQVHYIPVKAAAVYLENSYAESPVFVCGDNPFNLQGYWYFVKKVLPHVQQKIPNFELKVLGSACKNMFSTDGVQLMGYVSDLEAVYAASKFAICPLIGGTGQQIKIVEAMAHGLPVVAMKQTGKSSPIQHGVNGFIADSADEFAEYVTRLYLDLDLCKRLGNAARQTVQQSFSDKAFAEKLGCILETPLTQEERLPVLFPKVVVDGVFFQINRTGIARVWECILKEWVKSGFAEHVVVLDRAGTAPVIPGIRYRTVQYYGYANTALDGATLQAICDEERADVFISSYYTTPTTTPSVFMAYDMIPEVIGADLDNIVWREKHYGILHACRYITISENTARDLVYLFPYIDPETVTVAHCGLSPQFFPSSFNEVESFKIKFGIDRPYFVVVGERMAVGGYKNAILLFRALNLLSNRSDFAILCVGGQPQLESQLADLVPDVKVHLVQLSDEELRIAYSGAFALVYTSLYEGFGLPILEAMSCGCPVITCRNSSIAEVGAEAVLYVDEVNPTDILEALQILQDNNRRNALIQAGLEQAGRFSWSKMAAIVAQTLTQTAEELKDNPRPAKFDALWNELRTLHSKNQLTRNHTESTYNAQTQALQQHIHILSQQLEQNRQELELTRESLNGAKGRIEAMETSKFWKLRSSWFRIKKALGLPLNE